MTAAWTPERLKARDDGLIHYWGKVCASGHEGKRYVKSGECTECHSIRVAKLREQGSRERAHHRIKYREKAARLYPNLGLGITLTMLVARRA